VNRLYVPWFGNVVAKCATRQGDEAIQRRGRDVPVAPHRVQQLIACHELIRSFQELRNHGEHARLERNFTPLMQEAPIAQINQEIAAMVLGSTHRYRPRKCLRKQ
jgi:hypothetical protein